MPACSLCIALLFVQPGVNSFNISFLLMIPYCMQRKKNLLMVTCWWMTTLDTSVVQWLHNLTCWSHGWPNMQAFCWQNVPGWQDMPQWAAIFARFITQERITNHAAIAIKTKRNFNQYIQVRVFAHGCDLYCRCRNVDSAKNSVWSTILLNKYRTYIWAICESSLHVQLL